MKKGTVKEYLSALQGSEKFAPQVVWLEKIAARSAVYSEPDHPWPVQLKQALAGIGAGGGLYRHQAEAVNEIRAGNNVIGSKEVTVALRFNASNGTLRTAR